MNNRSVSPMYGGPQLGQFRATGAYNGGAPSVAQLPAQGGGRAQALDPQALAALLMKKKMMEQAEQEKMAGATRAALNVAQAPFGTGGAGMPPQGPAGMGGAPAPAAQGAPFVPPDSQLARLGLPGGMPSAAPGGAAGLPGAPGAGGGPGGPATPAGGSPLAGLNLDPQTLTALLQGGGMALGGNTTGLMEMLARSGIFGAF